MFSIISSYSCVVPKNYVYFNNLKDHPQHPNVIVLDSTTNFRDPKIEVNDLLSISIGVFNPLAEDEMLQKSAAGSGDNKAYAANTYLVDKDGYVELRMVGFVKVLGLTTAEARELIKQKAKEFYRDPIVNVHIVNFQVTVLGEITRPGVVKIESEKASILDVLALAGDLRTSSKRKNILLTRTENDKVTFARLDITSTDIYKSPYFYVKQRDQIYVEPSRFARQNTDNSFTKYLGMMSGLIGVVSLLFVTNIIKVKSQ
ncbi:polysaccharide biosynthesis/export family protein [Nemorincola caseinilytica]|uniref:Polysaccharide biosynthesis/export family protein n=1 Tax=Nemorincola caseinilytica TaxID=2054315 RepID=A0ABP8N6L2_9BACT